jgi:hypothetical protein
MADTPSDPPQRKRHKAPTQKAENAAPPVRARAARTFTAAGARPGTGRDSLASILAGMRELAGDLRRNTAAASYAQQCERLADRLGQLMTGEGGTDSGRGRLQRGAGPGG